MDYPFKNLVFKGGGVQGVAYAGAVEVLDEEQILQNIEQVAGTSAGAIASLLLALRYTPAQLKQIMLDLDFSRFTSRAEPLRFQEKYGWHSTKPVREWLEEQIRSSRAKGELSGQETFEDLKELGCRNLVVFATDLNRRDIVEFSEKETPRVKVVEAVLASLSIPAYFQSFQFTDNIPDDHIYVDGGALNNYPITAFDIVIKKDSHKELRANPETLGFHLEIPGHELPPVELGFGNFSKWAQQLYETVKNVQSSMLFALPEHVKRTVFIDTGTVSPVDFNLTLEQKNWLIDSGRHGTQAHLRMYRYRNSFRSRVIRRFMRIRKTRN